MLTPRFSLSQDDRFLTITIYAPFTNISETEVFIDGTDFRFFSKPYFLRLNLPGEIEENDDASGHYDADTSSFIVKAPKKIEGQNFEGLELLTELLKPKGVATVAECQNVEVLSQSDEIHHSDEDEDDEIDWYYEQVLPADEPSPSLSTEKDGYGFGFKRSGVFERLLEESQEILDVKNPDKFNWEERRMERLQKEDSEFDSDHYLCDLFEDQQLELLWKRSSLCNSDVDEEELKFTKDEQERLIGLPKRLDIEFANEHTKPVFYGLIDILFAYLYDYRTTDGEHSTESGWTIGKLSSTLSCCARMTSVREVAIACIRRSLIYPLYRHWKLSKKILDDVILVIKLGKVSIVKILLKISKIFNEYEGRHIFNDLYIHQYIAWVQSVRTSSLVSLAKSLESIVRQLTKTDVDLELIELETAAKMVLDEENPTKRLPPNVECNSDDSDDSDTEDSSTDSSSDTSSDDSDSDTACSSSETKSVVESLENEFNRIVVISSDQKKIEEVDNKATTTNEDNQKTSLSVEDKTIEDLEKELKVIELSDELKNDKSSDELDNKVENENQNVDLKANC